MASKQPLNQNFKASTEQGSFIAAAKEVRYVESVQAQASIQFLADRTPRQQ